MDFGKKIERSYIDVLVQQTMRLRVRSAGGRLRIRSKEMSCSDISRAPAARRAQPPTRLLRVFSTAHRNACSFLTIKPTTIS